MPVVPSSLAYTMLLVLRITRNEKLLLCDDVLMHGLHHLEILPGGQQDQAKSRARKGAKKAELSQKDDVVDLDAAQAVVRQLDLNDLKALRQALEHVNICGKLLEVCILQFVGSEVLCRLFGREPSPFIFMTASICAAYTLHRLLLLAKLPITLDGRTHADQGRMLSLLFPIYSLAFFLLVLLLPQGWVDINIDQAGQGILHGITAVKSAWSSVSALVSGESTEPSTQQWSGSPTESGTWQDSTPVPALLRWGILGITSVASGLMVPAMAIAGQRMGIAVATTLHPPPCLVAGGSTQAITLPVHRAPLQVVLTLLTGACPIFALLFWVTPITGGLLGFDQQQRAMAQGCAAICAGALQLLAIKLFLQSHLNTALERWYLAKHMKSKNRTKHGTLVATSLINNTSALLPRAAMLLLGPAALLVTLGCVICDSAALDRGIHEVSEPGEVTLYSVAPFIVPPTLTTQAMARCLACSGLLAHSASTMLVLVLRRTRVFRSTNV
eukprot:jgi/Ulvmu1/3126/UM015_0166.1